MKNAVIFKVGNKLVGKIYQKNELTDSLVKQISDY